MKDDDEFRSTVTRWVDGGKAVGIVAGIVDEQGYRVFGHGKMVRGRPEQPDAESVFEIGSITKVFTSLLLADMVERGEVKLDDAVAQYLPSDVKVPERNGRQITLLHLSQHVSGLPRLPLTLPIWFLLGTG